jgi:ankyrin repeat protein
MYNAQALSLLRLIQARFMETKTAAQRLIEAVRCGDRIAALLSIKAGANPNTVDETGNAVALIAGSLNYWDIVDDLLRCGANVEAQIPRTSHRLLHLAAAKGEWEAVCRLIRCRASLNPTNWNGQTPLDLSVWHQHHRVSELLEQNGARAQAQFHNVGDIAYKIARDYTIRYYGEAYACMCGHGLSKHAHDLGSCSGYNKLSSGMHESCTCDAFSDIWGREVPVEKFVYRALFGNDDLDFSE